MSQPRTQFDAALFKVYQAAALLEAQLNAMPAIAVPWALAHRLQLLFCAVREAQALRAHCRICRLEFSIENVRSLSAGELAELKDWISSAFAESDSFCSSCLAELGERVQIARTAAG